MVSTLFQQIDFLPKIIFGLYRVAKGGAALRSVPNGYGANLLIILYYVYMPYIYYTKGPYYLDTMVSSIYQL